MDKNKAKQARCLLYELENVQEIKDTIVKEAQSRWSFLTPDMKIFNDEGLRMPKVLREEFTKAVDRSIEKIEKQIEEL